MLITEAVTKPTFANHESFHLRYGWLKKTYDAVKEDGKEAESVGNIFKIGGNELGNMLTEACRTSKNIRMDTVNGALHLVYDDARATSMEILGTAYNSSLRAGQIKEATP